MIHPSEIIATIPPDAIKAIAIVIAIFCVIGWVERREWMNFHD